MYYILIYISLKGDVESGKKGTKKNIGRINYYHNIQLYKPFNLLHLFFSNINKEQDKL